MKRTLGSWKKTQGAMGLVSMLYFGVADAAARVSQWPYLALPTEGATLKELYNGAPVPYHMSSFITYACSALSTGNEWREPGHRHPGKSLTVAILASGNAPHRGTLSSGSPRQALPVFQHTAGANQVIVGLPQ